MTEPQTKMGIGAMAANAWDSVPLLSVAHKVPHTPLSLARDGEGQCGPLGHRGSPDKQASALCVSPQASEHATVSGDHKAPSPGDASQAPTVRRPLGAGRGV